MEADHPVLLLAAVAVLGIAVGIGLVIGAYVLRGLRGIANWKEPRDD